MHRLLGALGILIATAGTSQAYEDDRMIEAPSGAVLSARGPVVVFLNGAGGQLAGGGNDAAHDTASLVVGRGMDSLDVPAFSGSRAEWDRMVECVRAGYAPFDVEITDQRPRDDGYIMAMIGGRPSLLGYGRSVGGVAPWSGEVIHGAVAFVFADSMGNRPGAVCETAMHEIGHTLGLEHSFLCEDPMSYLDGCGAKSFQDVDAECGEYQARSCESGETQNSWRHLAGVVGLRGGQEPEVEVMPEPEPEPEIEADGQAPDLEVRAARAPDADGWLSIDVYAADASGIDSVNLGWATPEQTYLLRCDALPEEMPVTCTRDGDRYHYSLRVGRGARAFAVLAVDAVGNEVVSPIYKLWLRG